MPSDLVVAIVRRVLQSPGARAVLGLHPHIRQKGAGRVGAIALQIISTAAHNHGIREAGKTRMGFVIVGEEIISTAAHDHGIREVEKTNHTGPSQLHESHPRRGWDS